MESPLMKTVKQKLNEEDPTEYGDGKPSKEEIIWPAFGVGNEFAAHTTKPQQDHKMDGSGITIHTHIDRRQQPWHSLIRANVHDIKVCALPSMDATKSQVREWLYLVLACKEISGVADEKPHLISITLREWKKTGQALRSMEQGDWEILCPRKWRDVYGKKWHTGSSERKAIGTHIHNVVAPLVAAERKERMAVDGMIDEKAGSFDDTSTLVCKDEKVGFLFFVTWSNPSRIVLMKVCDSAKSGQARSPNSSASRLTRKKSLSHCTRKSRRVHSNCPFAATARCSYSNI
jgi:hypothetical protein